MKEIITNLNKTFDNRTRLGIMSLLLVDDWVEFKRLKELLGLTDGNLASHLKGLEEKKYIKLKKQFVGRKPMTTYACTASGRRAFEEHLDALEKLLQKRK